MVFSVRMVHHFAMISAWWDQEMAVEVGHSLRSGQKPSDCKTTLLLIEELNWQRFLLFFKWVPWQCEKTGACCCCCLTINTRHSYIAAARAKTTSSFDAQWEESWRSYRVSKSSPSPFFKIYSRFQDAEAMIGVEIHIERKFIETSSPCAAATFEKRSKVIFM